MMMAMIVTLVVIASPLRESVHLHLGLLPNIIQPTRPPHCRHIPIDRVPASFNHPAAQHIKGSPASPQIRWTRASRTDKGVHSLGTVVSMKLLVYDERYTSLEDPEGLSHADAINAHLPPSVRVFSVQRCNKKFNARHLASSRVYEYYLPR